MKTVLHFLCLLSAVAAGLAPAVEPAANSKPNIVFLLADDMGFMDIGAHNSETFYETPHIDSLARRGMRFSAGYAACCVCSPTRGSIMTGKYPPRTGVTEWIGGKKTGKLLPPPNQDHLALSEKTLAEALGGAGYATFMAGKWHLGHGRFAPNAQGFDSGFAVEAGGAFPPRELPPVDAKSDPKQTERIVDETVRFIEANRDKPFFAYVSFYAVHLPLGARPDLIEKYRRKAAGAPPVEWTQERGLKVRKMQSDPVYAAMVEQLDSAIGRLLAVLEKLGLTERTIVIFMSDNGGVSTAQGQPTANAPLRAGKGWPYEGGVRVPWIVAAPGVTKPGGVCDTPVISADFYPTLLELAGLPPLPRQHRDGVSLVPLLKGGALARGSLFWHYPHYGGQGGAPNSVIRDGDWKLIEWFEDGSRGLYHLGDDIGETNNLAATNAERVNELSAKLATWRKEVNALLPTPNPDWNSQPAESAGKKKSRKTTK